MVKKRPQIKKIISKYQTKLEELGIEVSKIILYGSYAGGRPKEYSDIDIIIVSPTFNKMDIFERQEVLSKAHHEFGEPIEPIGLTPQQMKEKKGLVREILEKGITLYPHPDLSPERPLSTKPNLLRNNRP
ncbi:MAG: nucleotidyltransferase domain-containing protein [Deltaproteobacteria bacterium]|nr:nucleotidyltransferase domain-containing protein [Deltaproteobacteria bacterium]